MATYDPPSATVAEWRAALTRLIDAPYRLVETIRGNIAGLPDTCTLAIGCGEGDDAVRAALAGLRAIHPDSSVPPRLLIDGEPELVYDEDGNAQAVIRPYDEDFHRSYPASERVPPDDTDEPF